MYSCVSISWYLKTVSFVRLEHGNLKDHLLEIMHIYVFFLPRTENLSFSSTFAGEPQSQESLSKHSKPSHLQSHDLLALSAQALFFSTIKQSICYTQLELISCSLQYSKLLRLQLELSLCRLLQTGIPVSVSEKYLSSPMSLIPTGQ